jgi:hypothetical protein
MMKSGSGSGPEAGDSSWTDETLPMGIRKELLDRELQQYIDRKRNAQSASSVVSSTDKSRGSSHPQADAPGREEHGD